MAALGVLVERGRDVGPGYALRSGVVDGQYRSGLGSDLAYTPFDERGDVIADLVDPVVQLDAVESYRRQTEGGSGFPGVLNGFEPEAGVGAVARIREGLLQRPGIDVAAVGVRGGCHHLAMPISREYARTLFADLTQNVTVPLDPDELLHMPGLRQHGHVFSAT